MLKNSFGFTVVVDGTPLPEITKDGNTFIAAPRGSEYQLRILKPSSHRRVEAVITVDGLNIITGKPGSVNDRGYIISDRVNLFSGFRLDKHAVAKFQFTESGTSYADSKGSGQNNGIIACVLFSEAVPYRRSAPVILRAGGSGSKGQRINSSVKLGTTLEDSYDSLLGAPSAGSVSSDLGTGFGARTDESCRETTFIRGFELARFVIRYASLQSLIDAGIVEVENLAPNPFPADKAAHLSFCAPPAGWEG